MPASSRKKKKSRKSFTDRLFELLATPTRLERARTLGQTPGDPVPNLVDRTLGKEADEARLVRGRRRK
jgi:hypothetical protein